MSEAEELRFELLEEIESAYRPPVTVQLVLYSIILIVTTVVLLFSPFSFDLKILAFLFVATYFYPLIVKLRGKIAGSIAIGLFASTISVLFYYLITKIQEFTIGNIAMLIIIMEILGVELLHHVSERLKFGRNKILWIADAILTAIFFGAMYEFLAFFFKLDIFLTLLIDAALSLLFFIAVIPEKPF